jgi:competence protein ComEA
MLRFFTILLASLALTLSAWAGINVNTASESELTGLPGIGPVKAEAIVKARTQNGPFKGLADLDAVPGIGPVTLANITPLVVFTADGKPAEAAPEGAAPAPLAASAVNINASDATGLQALPDIGPSKASAIVADRAANGPFASCDDLQRVKGIGTATVAGIANVCTTQ